MAPEPRTGSRQLTLLSESGEIAVHELSLLEGIFYRVSRWALPVFIDLQGNAAHAHGYPNAKSFRSDILDGYLEGMSFVFMALDIKCNFFDTNW